MALPSEPIPIMRDTPITPTSLKDGEDCTRYGVMLKATGKDRYDPLHALYGSAFGAGAAAYALNPADLPDVRRGRMLVEASKVWGPMQRLETKTWPNLIKVLFAFADTCDKLGLQGLESETRIIVTIVRPNGSYWKIGGAFDLLAKSDAGVAIHDFKAVSTEYMYSWATDPQVMHYTLLQFLRYKSDPWSTVMPNHIGHYFVAVLSGQGDIAFHTRECVPGLWRTLDTHIERCYKQYEDHNKIAAGGIHAVPTRFNRCDSKRPCYFIPQCYDDASYTPKDYVDTRTFSKVVHLQYDEAEFNTCVAELKSILQLKDQEVKKAASTQDMLSAMMEQEVDLNSILTDNTSTVKLLGDLVDGD